MKRKLTATNLIGPGVAPVDRAYLEVAPAYPFDDGSATNWDIPVRINLVDGAIPTVDQPLLEDTNDLGGPMTWNIRVVFEDARAKFIGGSRQVAFQLPAGTGDVDYTDLIPAEIVEPPEYGPTYLAQTLEARDETLSAAADAETAAANAAAFGIAGWANSLAFAYAGITRLASGNINTATITWPDGVTGTWATDTEDPTFQVITSFHFTRSGTPTVTFTQPTMTLDSNGSVVNQPVLVVS